MSLSVLPVDAFALCCDACRMLFLHDLSLAIFMIPALLNGCNAFSFDPFPFPLLPVAILES